MARPSLSFLAPRPVASPAPTPRALPTEGAPDPTLLALVGAEACLRWKILPWQRVGDGVLVFAEDARALSRAREALAPLGQIFLAPARAEAIRESLDRHLAGPLLARAEAAPPANLSVRGLPAGKARLHRRLQPACGIALVLTLLAPQTVFLACLCLMALTLFATTGFKLLALLASQTPDFEEYSGVEPVQWPVISVLVPLLREGPMVGRLIARLSALDYPPDHYELILIVEEDDNQTAAALSPMHLPPHARMVTVPRGRIQTKPRALNYALPFTRGTIIGVYDAEDRPAPDQLRRVAQHFAQAHPKVICLQGQLDYYNDRTNWLARCFTLEYCAWFRVILPGLARLGLPVPLGGTTLFIRRHALDALGGWDAHNVTEDADLGIRIARFGYRTEIIPTVTAEEANARPWPWIKQRSRWFKGYALTWAVHMRRPRALLRDLGWRGFLGLQITLLGALMTFLGAPVLWLHALMSVGGYGLLPGAAAIGLTGLFVLSWLVDLATQMLGARRAGKDHLLAWAPTTYGYFLMASIAAWRALVQALSDPFTWEKTEQGIYHDPPEVTAGRPPPAPFARQASGG